MTKVYQAIASVAKRMAEHGISKSKRNQQQGFNFRGIDDVYNTLAPMLADAGLVILPRMLSRQCTERANAKGTALFYVVVHAEFDLVAEDGSKHTISTFGEAMDSGDKATNKAMSAAYKYAAFQTFCIPTEETAADADAETHSVKPAKPYNHAGALAAIAGAADVATVNTYKAAASARATEDQQNEITDAAMKRVAELEQAQ